MDWPHVTITNIYSEIRESPRYNLREYSNIARSISRLNTFVDKVSSEFYRTGFAVTALRFITFALTLNIKTIELHKRM